MSKVAIRYKRRTAMVMIIPTDKLEDLLLKVRRAFQIAPENNISLIIESTSTVVSSSNMRRVKRNDLIRVIVVGLNLKPCVWSYFHSSPELTKKMLKDNIGISPTPAYCDAPEIEKDIPELIELHEELLDGEWPSDLTGMLKINKAVSTAFVERVCRIEQKSYCSKILRKLFMVPEFWEVVKPKELRHICLRFLRYNKGIWTFHRTRVMTGSPVMMELVYQAPTVYRKDVLRNAFIDNDNATTIMMRSVYLYGKRRSGMETMEKMLNWPPKHMRQLPGRNWCLEE